MDVDARTQLPIDLNPVGKDVRRKNEFQPSNIFPFKTWQSLPSFSTALLNISLSVGTLIVSAAGLAVTLAVILPLGILKSVGGRIFAGKQAAVRDNSGGGISRRRCVVIHGASSGIGAALALEYAAADTHLVLIARDHERLNEVATRAQARGATTATHSLDFFEPASTTKLHHLLREIDAKADGIDVAIQCTGVTIHRSDRDGDGQADVWGTTAASRMLQVNVAACQEFILGSWELMKARRQQQQRASSQLQGSKGDQDHAHVTPGPKIIVLSSSTAFFTPANFALYAASKAYLYTLARSLQVASAPYGIGVVTVTPGFIESGMTLTAIQAGATTPLAVLGDPRKLARKIKRGEERNELVVFYPLSQVCALWSARALNPLLETVGMWAGSAMGVAGWFFS
ncbi:NAD(P)-binding protein [Canariomyces notabilis]|uniref:NAD(P)-binding protein n=1 Tax=Canariomyces notabilis TaxID=2074819 RepID=A0AAN6TC09_9PEZI|nr:NAD(P)-binding protein [Canariomyces arenarius]